MAKDEDEEASKVPAGLAGAAVYQGLPLVVEPALGMLPASLAELALSGQPIKAEYGTPLSRLSEFTRQEANVIRDFAKAQGVTVPIVGGGVEAGGQFVQPAGPLGQLLARLTGNASEGEVIPHIALGQSSVPVAMHEIGHASSIAGSDKLRRSFQLLANAIGQGSVTGNVLRAAIAANVFAPPGEDASATRQFMYNNAPALVGATMVPQLLEEGRASLKAIRGAREHGVGVLSALRELAPGFGTYLAGAAAPILATLLARKVVQSLAKRSEEPKTAAAMPGAEVKAPGALRADASSAWKIGQNPPKPKTIGPNARLGADAQGRAAAKPPSKTSYYKDMLGSLYNPQRGSRLATPTS